MTDPRSSPDAHVWVGGDGRVHTEPERPPLSVFGVLDTIAWDIAESRTYEGHGQTTVVGLCAWLRAQLDWLTRQDSVSEVNRSLRTLVSQLKPVTGDPRRHIGHCPNTIDEGEHTRTCGSRLYLPMRGDSIVADVVTCRVCGREWPRAEWLRLVDLLAAS
jgi:hypothetical protein